MLRLADALRAGGHEVQLFGMADSRNIGGNDWDILTGNIEFHGRSLKKLLYPFKIIYSLEARRKMRRLLRLYRPDIVHLNNFNFQLTPSILYAAKKEHIPLVMTAHDYQLICPGHLLYRAQDAQLCEECLEKGFLRCFRNRCIHGSRLRSLLGGIEAVFYRTLRTYKLLDTIVCPSAFLEQKLLHNPVFHGKTVVLHNFVQNKPAPALDKREYVLYFGRFSQEKGISTLAAACRLLPDIQFICAGSGPLAPLLDDLPNVKCVGFQTGEALEALIRGALFTVCPSECYENCPFAVMESQMYMSPVIGANIGGIPELVQNGKTGLLFQSCSAESLVQAIHTLWSDRERLAEMTRNCADISFATAEEYSTKMIALYQKLRKR